MKIVHVTNYFMPQMGYQENFLAKYQAQMGHEVHVVTSNRVYPAHEDYKAFSSNFPERIVPVGMTSSDGYQVHRLEAYGEKNMQLFMKWIFATIRKIDPDLVVVHNLTRYESLRISAWKKLMGRRFKLVADDHSLFVVLKFDWYRRIFHSLVRFLLHRCGLLSAIDKVVAVTEETKTLLHEHYYIPLDRITVLPISANTKQFQFSQEERDRVRKKLQIPADFVILGYFGKIASERGVDLAYDVSRELFKRYERFGLLLVGSGIDSNFAQKLKERIQRDGFTERVFWHPQVKHHELPGFYSAADIATWPKLASMACLEAASCGLPIVISNMDVCRERVAGGNGYVWESDAYVQQAIDRLISDLSLRREMGQKGKVFVQNNFDWEAVARKFLFQGQI